MDRNIALSKITSTFNAKILAPDCRVETGFPTVVLLVVCLLKMLIHVVQKFGPPSYVWTASLSM